MSGIPPFLSGGPANTPLPEPQPLDIGAAQQALAEQIDRLNLERREWVVENGGRRRAGLYFQKPLVADEIEANLKATAARYGIPEFVRPTPQQLAEAQLAAQFSNREFSSGEIEFYNDILNRKVAPTPATFAAERASLMKSLGTATSADHMMNLSQQLGEVSRRQADHRPAAFKALAEAVRDEMGVTAFNAELADAKVCPQWLPEYASDAGILRIFASKGRYLRAYDAAKRRIR